MLNELDGLQKSDESVSAISVSFDVETRSKQSGEVVHGEYSFSYVPECDKWTFTEYTEKRASDSESVRDRDWKQSRHIMWHDRETPTIEVPPEVANKLQEATGADSIVMQIPTGGAEAGNYKEVYVADD